MTTKSLLCISLLITPLYIHSVILESKVLQTIDGNIFAWDSVCTLKTYQKQIKHFLNQKYTVGNNAYNLFDFAIKEKNNTIATVEKEAFNTAVAEFVRFSVPFIDTITPLKRIIAPLIEESCAKRNRTQSALHIWITSEDGQEEILFRKYINTFRSLAELCMDILNFTDDLLVSCPHAMKSYNDFFERVSELEPIIKALLVTEHIHMDHSSVNYHTLIRYIAERFSEGEQITVEKTARLFHAFNNKKGIK